MKRFLPLFFLALLTACQTTTVAPLSSNDWDQFVQGYIERYFVTHPTFAVNAGRHEFDGKLPDMSEAGLKRESTRLRTERERAVAFDPATLDERQRLERDNLIANIDGELFFTDSAGFPYKSPLVYSMDPSVYITRPYAPLPQRMRAYIDYLNAIPTVLAQARANLRTPLARPYIDVSKNVFSGYASYFKNDVPAVFQSVTDARLQSDFRTATDRTVKAMEDFAAWLDAQTPQATNNYALGPELFRMMLFTTERVDIPLDELEQIGRRDLERNLAALRSACAQYAPGATVQQCVDRANTSKPEGGPVAVAREQLTTLRKFVADHDIVSIPGTEEAKVEEAPPYNRNNFAYIDIPGPFEKNMPSVYYIAPPDPTWTPEVQRAYIPGKADLLFTSVHEVWPGHFLQFLHANRAGSKFGQLFVGYAFAEGWAHYTEEMMWEAGLGDGDPETHIGQLLNALLRDVRFISAIGLHTKGMTVEESERMFRELAYQDPGNAEQQARRGTYDPGYLNYTMGKLMIMKLRDDWTRTRGGRTAWKEFHNKFLAYGGPPIPLVRRAMLGDEGALFP